jgi:hypothetical protein
MPTTLRTFDYVPRLDDRNRAYRVTAAPDLADVSRFWTPSALVLDQGREGQCVGAGITHEYGATPVRGRIHPAMMTEVYRRAQQLDEWPGEAPAYEGTSVRAGMLVGRERGWWDGFRWAFNLGELRAALEEGPVVVGVEWRDGMYSAPGGIVTVDGPVVGGHCLLITGYTRRHPTIGGPAYRWRNSWSTSYGLRGNAYVRPDDLDRILFQAGGEAAVPVGRRLG